MFTHPQLWPNVIFNCYFNLILKMIIYYKVKLCTLFILPHSCLTDKHQNVSPFCSVWFTLLTITRFSSITVFRILITIFKNLQKENDFQKHNIYNLKTFNEKSSISGAPSTFECKLNPNMQGAHYETNLVCTPLKKVENQLWS